MKYWSLSLVFFLLVSFQEKARQLPISSETKELIINDQDFLLDYFEKTEDHLKEITEGLSKAQLNYKAAENRWSISQVLEHIVLTEQALFRMTEEMMAQEPAPERRSEIKITDEELISGIIDRSDKYQASPELQPSGIYTDHKVALYELEEQRQPILEFIKNTSEEDLRDHISDSPFGPLDAYQSLLFIGGHTARHTKQIEEVLANPGFPQG